ncbi:MAG TPA: Gfo/Idh/MocA family oxidoreductase [Gaiellaceae bacterium]|nr:Gfo/Idh/MocA family oxidoreductase [Gaiellaceae bacterium]
MGFYAQLDRGALFERADVYRVAYDPERATREPLRVAILGAGGVAQAKYLPALAQLRTRWEQFELVGLSTLDARQAEKLSTVWGTPAYTDSVALLREREPEVVIVTSSDEAHRELAVAALEAGAHVLVEKPIALSLRAAEEICSTAEATGRTLMTTCNKRYSPPYAETRRLLVSGMPPRPALFSAKFTLGYAYIDLLESGTVHLFDLARWLMGDIRRVAAAGAFASSEHIVVTLDFQSGAIGSLVTSARALSLHPWERVEIFGDGAWLAVDDQRTLTLHEAEFEPARRWAPVVPSTLLSAEEWGGYVGMLEAFFAAVRRRDAAGIRDGYRALELVVATRLALARGTAVELPLDPDDPDLR